MIYLKDKGDHIDEEGDGDREGDIFEVDVDGLLADSPERSVRGHLELPGEDHQHELHHGAPHRRRIRGEERRRKFHRNGKLFLLAI